MLRPSSIARKIIRVRTARLLSKSFYHPLQQYTPLHLDKYPPPSFPPTREPLYVPEPDVAPEVENVPDEEQVEHSLKLRLTKLAEDDHAEYDEMALRDFYAAVVSSGAEEAAALEASQAQIEAPGASRMDRDTVQRVLGGLEKRLLELELISLPPADSESTEVDRVIADTDANMERAIRIAAGLSAISIPSSSSTTIGFSVKGKEKEVVRPADVSVGLVSQTEWEALFESFMSRRDTRGAEALLAVMMQHGVRPAEEQLNRVIRYDAQEGRTEEISRLIGSFAALGGEVSAVHHNSILTSLLTSSTQTALQYLREFEGQGQPLPQACYNHLLTHFTTSNSVRQSTTHTQALAWELFTHMRLHAHPVPDKAVYTTMIKACGDSRNPQPERARDLWTEMTTEGNEVKPARDEYDAIIRALGGTKGGYLEAFDLLREMLARHNEAVIAPFEDQARKLWSPHVPTLSTFNGLLEGTKRAGDIERARWVLSEFLGLVGSSIEIQQPMKGPEEEMLSNIFMTYAAWKPKVTRRGVRVKAAEDEMDVQLEARNLERVTEAATIPDDVERRSPRTTSPTTSADALREASALFERILLDTKAKQQGETNFFVHPFAGVTLRTRLVNSYLSVWLEHAASTEDAYKAWARTWNKVEAVDASVKPNAWSYLMLLERCAAGRRKEETAEDKAMAAAWGKRVWKEYIDFVAASETLGTATAGSGAASATTVEETGVVVAELRTVLQGRRQRWLAGLGPRQIERCWKAIIRLYAMTNHTALSLALLQEFQRRYPQSAITEDYQPLKLFALGSKFTDTTRTPDADVPPHLLFTDVDVLHQRLVRKEDWDGIARLKYITKEYEHELLKRRMFRRKNVGLVREKERYQKALGVGIEAPQKGRRRVQVPEPADDEAMDAEWPRLETPEEPGREKRKPWASYA